MASRQRLRQLYQKVILGHSRDPYHYEEMTNPSYIIEAYNPLCGDKYKLFLQLDGERIKKASFSGYGCAISKASTSILVQRLEGLLLSEVLPLRDRFIRSSMEEADPANEEFEAFSAARSFPGRSRCVSLSWDSLQEWLEQRLDEE